LSPFSRWRLASARTRRSSRCSTRCFSVRLPSASRSGWSTSAAPGPNPGSQSCTNPATATKIPATKFRDLEAERTGVQRRRGASLLPRGERRLPQPDAERRRNVRCGIVTRGAWAAAGARAALYHERRPDHPDTTSPFCPMF
jgi:hypothetical protein